MDQENQSTQNESVTELVRILDEGIKRNLCPATLDFYNMIYRKTGGDLSRYPRFEDTYLVFAQQVTMRRFNFVIKDLIENDQDSERQMAVRYMKNAYDEGFVDCLEFFQKLKKASNHSYGCLIGLIMDFATDTYHTLDLSQVKFDGEKGTSENLEELFDEVLKNQRDAKIQAFSHTCNMSDDDITKWDPEDIPFARNNDDGSIIKGKHIH